MKPLSSLLPMHNKVNLKHLRSNPETAYVECDETVHDSLIDELSQIMQQDAASDANEAALSDLINSGGPDFNAFAQRVVAMTQEPAVPLDLPPDLEPPFDVSDMPIWEDDHGLSNAPFVPPISADLAPAEALDETPEIAPKAASEAPFGGDAMPDAAAVPIVPDVPEGADAAAALSSSSSSSSSIAVPKPRLIAAPTLDDYMSESYLPHDFALRLQRYLAPLKMQLLDVEEVHLSKQCTLCFNHQLVRLNIFFSESGEVTDFAIVGDMGAKKILTVLLEPMLKSNISNLQVYSAPAPEPSFSFSLPYSELGAHMLPYGHTVEVAVETVGAKSKRKRSLAERNDTLALAPVGEDGKVVAPKLDNAAMIKERLPKVREVGFFERMSELALKARVKLIKIEDKQFQKQCLMSMPDGTKFKLMVYYNGKDKISKLMCSSQVPEVKSFVKEASEQLVGTPMVLEQYQARELSMHSHSKKNQKEMR